MKTVKPVNLNDTPCPQHARGAREALRRESNRFALKCITLATAALSILGGVALSAASVWWPSAGAFSLAAVLVALVGMEGEGS